MVTDWAEPQHPDDTGASSPQHADDAGVGVALPQHPVAVFSAGASTPAIRASSAREG